MVPAWNLRVSYFELQVTSYFSFLRGASSCEELFAQASLLGVDGLAVVDRNSLAGIVRAHEAAKTTGIRQNRGRLIDSIYAHLAANPNLKPNPTHPHHVQ